MSNLIVQKINGSEYVLPLGVGQSWYDMTAERNAGVTYTNTTGRTLVVALTFSIGSHGKAYAYVDDLLVASSRIYDGVAGAHQFACSFLVPNGSTYRTTNFAVFWSELR
ncbi:hypothetical protein [Curvivirga sp.]|uniref:hypothetical protein n=1 Tax=Curvivirga sp. TaxID=2856848 RepID=UPI003B5ACD45